MQNLNVKWYRLIALALYISTMKCEFSYFSLRPPVHLHIATFLFSFGVCEQSLYCWLSDLPVAVCSLKLLAQYHQFPYGTSQQNLTKCMWFCPFHISFSLLSAPNCFAPVFSSVHTRELPFLELRFITTSLFL